MSTRHSVFRDRAAYSEMRLDELSSRLAKAPQVKALENFTIFSAGSYGRLEASNHSDIDLFFLYEGDRATRPGPRTNELRLFGALIEIVDEMDFPSFSNDSQYLNAQSSAHVLEHLGSPQDDHENLFTLRMLMLLESKCLYGDEAYAQIVRSIITSYFRDYPDHQASFEPWFLLNDIGRFWKTLLLNYENKRNQPATEGADKTKQKVRNFKLKFSRMTTCFATIAALGSSPAPVDEDRVFEIIQRTPFERLEIVAEERPDCISAVDAVLVEYAWFLEQTGLTTSELRSLFEDKTRLTTMFQRANAYGDKMYELLATIDQTTGSSSRFLRYLVI